MRVEVIPQVLLAALPVRMDIVVVFPAPLCPRRAVIWPLYMLRERSLTALALRFSFLRLEINLDSSDWSYIFVRFLMEIPTSKSPETSSWADGSYGPGSSTRTRAYTRQISLHKATQTLGAVHLPSCLMSPSENAISICAVTSLIFDLRGLPVQ